MKVIWNIRNGKKDESYMKLIKQMHIKWNYFFFEAGFQNKPDTNFCYLLWKVILF